MTTSPQRHRQDVALFRYGLVAQIIACPPGDERNKVIANLADKNHPIPGSNRTRVAEGTLKDWVRNYEHRGYDGLKPKTRCERAQPRRMPAEVSETLLAIKNNTPVLSVRQVIAEGRRTGEIPPDVPVSPSTVYRLFAREGLMVKYNLVPGKDMRRFQYRYPGELWQADVMHGPKIPDAKGRRHKTYLLAILDDATII